MSWYTVAAKAALALVPKDKATSIMGIIAVLLCLPVPILVILWNPFATTGEQDMLQRAVTDILRGQQTYDIAGQYKSDGCMQNMYLINEVRVYENYVDQSKRPTDYATYRDTIDQEYFQGCVLRDDDEIKETLVLKYGITQEQFIEIEELLQEIRSLHIPLIPPIEEASVIVNYTPKTPVVVFEGKRYAEVHAASEGTVVQILDNKEKVELPCYMSDCKEETFSGGKTVVIEYTAYRNLMDDGNFQQDTIHLVYAGLRNTQVQEGERVTQGQLIGTTRTKHLMFALEDREGNRLDPRPYITLISEYNPQSIEELKAIEKRIPLNVSYRVTSEYDGNRVITVNGKTLRGHAGIDLACPRRTEIVSATTGTVVAVFYDSIGGNQIVVKTGNFYFQYCHMNEKSFRKKGETVAMGDMLGYVGMTGAATGYHLHFEIAEGGYNIGTHFNPRRVFEFD